MKTVTTPTAKYLPSALHDLKRDWDCWSLWERRAATALGVLSGAMIVFWLAASFSLLG